MPGAWYVNRDDRSRQAVLETPGLAVEVGRKSLSRERPTCLPKLPQGLGQTLNSNLTGQVGESVMDQPPSALSISWHLETGLHEPVLRQEPVFSPRRVEGDDAQVPPVGPSLYPSDAEFPQAGHQASQISFFPLSRKGLCRNPFQR